MWLSDKASMLAQDFLKNTTGGIYLRTKRLNSHPETTCKSSRVQAEPQTDFESSQAWQESASIPFMKALSWNNLTRIYTHV